MVGKVDESVGVSPLVIVPGDNLDEFWAKLNTSLGIEDGGDWARNEILGDNILISVSEDTLHWSLSGGLHGGTDISVGGVFLESDGKINNGNVGGWDSESHTGELSVELWDNLTNSLGSTGGGWDDVSSSGSSGSPVFTSLGWSIDGKLVHGGGVDGGHETLLNSVGVVENLGDWSKAVGGAGSVGDNGHLWVVLLLVDTENEDWDVVLWWGGEDNLLGTSLKMELTLLLGKENTGRLANVVGTSRSPLNLGWVGLVEDLDGVSVNLDTTINLLDGSLESSVDGIVLEEIDKIVEGHEWVVDGHDLGDVLVSNEGGSEDKSTDSSESVDT